MQVAHRLSKQSTKVSKNVNQKCHEGMSNHHGHVMMLDMEREGKKREKDKESVSTGTKRRKLEKGSWVRTRESRGGLSEGGKGGLLHSQLVELGQLLRVRRDSRAKSLLL